MGRSHEKSIKDKRRSRSKEPRSEPRKESEKVTDNVPLPSKIGNEQENIIDSTNDVTENVVYHQKIESRSRRSSSPSPVKKERMKERSLSPGTKEIRAYWAEQEEKKRKKKSKKSKDKERDEDIDMFAAEVETEKKRHASGSSIDSIEKLRLQALETLKSRAQQHQDKMLYDSDDDQVYIEKKSKKSKKKKDKDKSPDPLGLLEEILETRKKVKEVKV